MTFACLASSVRVARGVSLVRSSSVSGVLSPGLPFTKSWNGASLVQRGARMKRVFHMKTSLFLTQPCGVPLKVPTR